MQDFLLEPGCILPNEGNEPPSGKAAERRKFCSPRRKPWENGARHGTSRRAA